MNCKTFQTVTLYELEKEIQSWLMSNPTYKVTSASLSSSEGGGYVNIWAHALVFYTTS